jgi:hypothetical protein
MMDCRVKPGNDHLDRALTKTVTTAMPYRHSEAARSSA